jgi:hypothetical protein
MLDPLKEVKYNVFMKQKAPTSVEALTGAVITTAEAMATRNSIMDFLAVDLKEIHSDLSFMQDRHSTRWTC